ncbi:hypothetical protein P5V15_014058 [Pogonomyrmex californicus]
MDSKAALSLFLKSRTRHEYPTYYITWELRHLMFCAIDCIRLFAQPYNVLIHKLEEFYAPAPLEIAENYRFHQQKQCEGESVQQFVAAFHKLSIHCKFGGYYLKVLEQPIHSWVAK